MKKQLKGALLVLTLFLPLQLLANPNQDSIIMRRLANEILLNGQCYQNLETLCKSIGGRLAGSIGASKAVAWALEVMSQTKANSYTQPCWVPHWVRGGAEKATIMRSGALPIDLHVCSLGNSIGTNNAGLKARVIEILRWTQLDSLGEKIIKNNIVFYNRPMDPTTIDPGAAYGHCVDQRWAGASRAAKYGAVAVLVRSVTHSLDNWPHTGVMKYDDAYTKIPAMAIATLDANILHNAIAADADVQVYMQNFCAMLPDELSANVIAEIKGSTFPNEIITVGGHLDAWDNGDGAHDDGAGVVQGMEVIRAFMALGIQPKRTIRFVAFMNEENGGKGGKAYADSAKAKHETHTAAIESDGGGFTPTGWGVTADSITFLYIKKWEPLFLPYNLFYIFKGGGGADINPLREINCVTINPEVDGQRYFDYHHTANDVFENINKRELTLGAVAEAQMVYLLSEHGTKPSK
jgi:carboxypeptidase Q